MLKCKVLLILPLFLGFAFAGGNKDRWKYAGEDHGVRFFFRTAENGRGGKMVLKLENTLPVPVELTFRVKDLEWKSNLASSLEPHGKDSSLVVRLAPGSPILYPYVDRVFIESSGPDETVILTLD